jgi:hypothetical protein
MSQALPKMPLAASAVLIACAFLSTTASGAKALTPLPASAYTVSAACPQPEPGHASCLADQLVPLSAEAREHLSPIGRSQSASVHASTRAPREGYFGLRPADLHTAYDLPTTTGSEQTIALVDAYNDPTAASDLAAYEKEFKLGSCSGMSCFRRVNERGLSAEADPPFPKTVNELEMFAKSGNEDKEYEARAARGWGVEISLDIESARAICQSCHILLVEADSTSYTNLEAAEETAYGLGATEISNSWGGPEEAVSETGAFDHPGTVITASTGDDGYLGWDAEYAEERGFAEYPASSPDVVAVGGTHLSLTTEGHWSSETVWNGDGATGGGCATAFAAPTWQRELPDWSAVGCGGDRSEADVSADGDPYTGVAITDDDYPGQLCTTEYEHRHWCTYGGTSLASPAIASMFALAGGSHGVAYPARTLYESLANAPATLHDVTYGSSGECTRGFDSEGYSLCEPATAAAASCSGELKCLAGPGYDGPSGVGTPDGIDAFLPGEHEVNATGSEGGGTSHETTTTPPGTPAPPSSTATSPPPSSTGTVTAPVVAQLSALALTPSASAALRRHRQHEYKLAFSFVLNVAARVQATLWRQVRLHGRYRWLVFGWPATIGARAGHNSDRFASGRMLAAGLYRVTLTTTGGPSRSIDVRVG